MKTFHKIKIAVCVLLLALLAVSCIPKQESIGGAGQTILKLFPAGYTMLPFDAVATVQTGLLFEVRRDVPNSAALNTETTVVLQYDATHAILDTFNVHNETSFVPLPVSLGTTTPAPVGGKIILTFAAGEFSKSIIVNIPNASAFDFTKQYAIAYKMTEVTGTGTKSAALSDTIIAQLLIKNKYDGSYEVTANSPMVDAANSALTGWYPFLFDLETSGEHSVTCLLADPDPGYFDYYHPITSGGNYGVYGAFGLELEFDHSGNGNILAVRNTWGNPPSNTRMPAIDPSGVNKWDAATNNIQFKYWMLQPNTVTSPPYIRVYFDETWTYKGPRD
ncbi:MAG: DUF1735 domain-containing protein [Bacteroidia bacterium]|nr:DUF1735 domain-containing protein [Bacteroidia bacterium]